MNQCHNVRDKKDPLLSILPCMDTVDDILTQHSTSKEGVHHNRDFAEAISLSPQTNIYIKCNVSLCIEVNLGILHFHRQKSFLKSYSVKQSSLFIGLSSLQTFLSSPPVRTQTIVGKNGEKSKKATSPILNLKK